MKRISMCLPYLLTLLLLVSFTSFAQQEGSITGGLSGQVTDKTGASLPGVTVTLAGPQGKRVLTTDSLGRYNATGLTPGYYDITIEKAGFSKVESKHNEVVVNSSSNLNITLGIGNVSETVEVTAAAAGIDTQSTAITTNLTDSFYNSVPVPRNVSSIFYVAPGVAQGQVAGTANQTGPGASNPSIGGSSPLENLYVVDGVTITDQAFGSIGTFNRYHGSLGTGINLAFIKEVDVKTTAFEPQYGKATGGIVQIVTKSGSNNYHGAIGAYFGPGAFYASRYQFYQFGYLNATPSQTLSSPQYDVSAEFGGYVPHFKDKLFFFGAFDPSLTQNVLQANPHAPAASVALGALEYSTTTLSWAGKLTYKLGNATTLEGSSFGDPSKHNTVPSSLSSFFPISSGSSYRFGSRDSVARVTSALTSTWLVDAAYTYNYNHFDETPAQNIYGISDQSQVPLGGATTASGLGGFEPSKNYTYSIGFNTSKTLQLLGQHTFSVGYIYDHTNFEDNPSRSGPLYPIPAANANGKLLSDLYPGKIPAGAVGSLTNAQFTLAAANTKAGLSTIDNTCTQCPILHGQRVYASVSRGSYGGLHVLAQAKYHSAYFNDNYQLNRFVNFTLGVRWEQERMSSVNQNYNYGAEWSPRVGVTIDPIGDHKSKLFFNFGRNYWAIPLDAAIRELGNEQDDNSYVFAPVIAADGTITIVPDSAHVLNGLPKSSSTGLPGGTITPFGRPSYSFPAESILSGTKGEYEDEYVIGVEREVKSGLVLKARYTDRRFGRIVEDIGSQSPEGSVIVPGFVGGIANPGPSTDIAVNEKEITYTAAQFNAAQAASQAAGGKYVAPVPGCTAANDAQTLFTNGLNQAVGGACITNVDTADAGPPDGIPDGFIKPVRRYQAAEFEVNKRFSNHWLAVINYRWGTLYGNYEGAYRNDNGQSDPGISSLFDFTAGALGLLGSQFDNGFLNSDRRNTGNLFLSYNVSSSTPFFHMLKGLTFGTGLRGQSGVPLSVLGSHPIYLSAGEVPVGGRGAAGRTPSSLQLDLHTDYPVPLPSKFERYKLKLAMDMFNVTNSQFETSKSQTSQLALPGVGLAPSPNLDYGRPTAFQTPFYARGSVRFEF